ncbi:MAG: AAA family ATPase [Candidatus Woesearchaeota archaeon]
MAIERYVLTGGTYSGKSSLIDFLQKEGFNVFPEAIIASRDELNKAGINHHKNHYAWTELIIKKATEYFESASDGINFYDRGMPCYVLFSAERALNLYDRLYGLCRSMKYSSPVFFLETIKPFVPHRRDISEKSNTKIEEKTRAFYTQLGYELAEIPYFTSDEKENNLRRKELILGHCLRQ